MPPKSLALALWSLWQKLRDSDPNQVLRWVKNTLKVDKVEVAGFAQRSPKELSKCIADNGLSVYSIHAPSRLVASPPRLFLRWCEDQLALFNTETVVVRSDDARIRAGNLTFSSAEKYYMAFADFLEQTIDIMIRENRKMHFQMHCFDFDYLKPFPGKSLSAIEYLCSRLPAKYFSVQLDACWLRHHADPNPMNWKLKPNDSTLHAIISPILSRIASIHVSSGEDMSLVAGLQGIVQPILECDPYHPNLEEALEEAVSLYHKPGTANIPIVPFNGSRSSIVNLFHSAISQTYQAEFRDAIYSNLFQFTDDYSLRQCKFLPQPNGSPAFVVTPDQKLLPRYEPLVVIAPEDASAAPKDHSLIAATASTLASEPSFEDVFRRIMWYRVNAYVSERKVIAGQTFDELTEMDLHSSFGQERQLDHHFLPRKQLMPTLLFIVANEGVGKTTFLDHYFGYYLPNRPSFPKYDRVSFGSEEEWQCLWSRNIILYANARSANSLNSILESLSEAIAMQCQRLAVDERFADCREQISAASALLAYDRDALRAIRHLAAITRDGVNRLFFLTVVFDNADQLAEAVYTDLLHWVTRAAGQQMSYGEDLGTLWRVFVPMRIETQVRFEHTIRPNHNYEVLPLGCVALDVVLDRRGLLLKHVIIEGRKHYEFIHPLDGLLLPAYTLEIPEYSGETVRAWLTDSAEDTDEGNQKFKNRQSLWSIVTTLCSESPRRMISVRGRMAESRTVQKKCNRGERVSSLSRYYKLDAILCGKMKYFQPNMDHDCPFLDLFSCGHPGEYGSNPSAKELWAGLFSATLLSRGIAPVVWHEEMSRAGFSTDIVNQVQDRFEAKGFLKRVLARSDRREGVDESGLAALCLVVEEEAYVDCCAARFMSISRGVAYTDSCEIGEFIPRVKHSVSYLSVLSAALKSFVVDSEPQILNDIVRLRINNPLQRMCLNYVSRLTCIREEQKGMMSYFQEKGLVKDLDAAIDALVGLIRDSGSLNSYFPPRESSNTSR